MRDRNDRPDRRGPFGGYHEDEIMILEGRIMVRPRPGVFDFARWERFMASCAEKIGIRWFMGINILVLDEPYPASSWGQDDLGAGEYQGA